MNCVVLLDETGMPIGVQQKLMRHANVSTAMNVYGNAALKARQQANTKVVQMVLRLGMGFCGVEVSAVVS